MNIKAIVSDIDGTLLDSPRQTHLSERMLTAIITLKNLGVEFYLATSRSFPNVKHLLEVLPSQNPAILYGGAEIIQPDGTILVQYSIASDKVVKIIEITSKLDFSIITDGANGRKHYQPGATPNDIENPDNLKRIVVFQVSPELVGSVVERFSGVADISCHVVPSGEVAGMFNIHLTDNRADKGQATKELAQVVGISPSEMLAVGDGHNDLSLFEAVGYKVAMGNAVDELKQKADRVIGDVADDGLAEFLEELVSEIKTEGR